jgi:hypothetical protein
MAEMEKIARKCGAGFGTGAKEAFSPNSLISKVNSSGFQAYQM